MQLRLRDPNNPDAPLAPQLYQWDFVLSPAFATLFSKGWGGGGSYGGLAWMDYTMLKSRPRSIGYTVLPTYPHLSKWINEQFEPAFHEMIQRHNRQEKIFEFKDGRRMYYQSASDPDSLQITSADWAYLDEAHLMPPAIWRSVMGRVRGPKGIRRRVGAVSLPRMGWLSDEFGKPEYEGQGTSRRRIIYGETAWNTYLDPEYAAELRASCPASMLDAYLRGRFVPAGGSVWPEFSLSRHVVPWRYETQVQGVDGFLRETGVTLSCDWGSRAPHVQFWHRVPEGVRVGSFVTQHEIGILVDELYPNGLLQSVTTERMCGLARARAKERGYRLDRIVCDPAGAGTQSTSGESDMAIAHRIFGLPVVGVGHPVVVGVQHVQWALDPVVLYDKQGRALNHPRLFIAKDLVDHPYDPKRVERSTVQSIPAYSYKEIKRGKPIDHNPVKDDIHDHATDTTRYFVYDAWPQDRLGVDVRPVS